MFSAWSISGEFSFLATSSTTRYECTSTSRTQRVEFSSRSKSRCSSGALLSRASVGRRTQQISRSLVCSAAVQLESPSVQSAKASLRACLAGSGRGLNAERGVVAEKQLGVEHFGTEWEERDLEGKWRLIYTTASDVLGLIQLENSKLVQVGDIFQEFCGDNLQNIVLLSTPFLLQPAKQGDCDGGLTLRVLQSWRRVGPRTIAVQFNEAQLGEVQISDQLEQIITPAFLPRTFLNMRILQFIRGLNLKVPLRSFEKGTENSGAPLSDGTCYHLTYLDQDMLIGRASGSGGTFIFEKVIEEV